VGANAGVNVGADGGKNIMLGVFDGANLPVGELILDISLYIIKRKIYSFF
jgi:hypothetical protein